MKAVQTLSVVVLVAFVRSDVDLDAELYTNLQSLGAINSNLWRSLTNVQQMWVQTVARQQGELQRKAHYQDRIEFEFPCDLSVGRSDRRPTSVHRLRPGDIQVIGAIGDSLTSASGALSTRLGHMFTENRGLSWCVGGQWDWRNSTTLPNIMKLFNPKLIGYSLNDSFTYNAGTEFNVAEIAAVSKDLPNLARVLVERMRKDPRVDFENDWKFVTITIGANDICSGVCGMKDPNKLPKMHKKNLLEAMRHLRDYLPRTLVNVVSKPKVKNAIFYPKKDPMCKNLHMFMCSCFAGLFFNVTKESRALFERIEVEFMQVEEDVTLMDEFRNLDTFAAVYQPFSTDISLNMDGKGPDRTLLAYDCFHISQKAHAYAGTSYWNNLLEPVGKKSTTWSSPAKRILCPSMANPFIFTYENS